MATSAPARTIYLVDDHPILLDGLEAAIQRKGDCAVVGRAESVNEALEEIVRLNPELVIADIGFPERGGLDLIKDLRAIDPSILILVYSMHDEMVYAERAIRAGARGYIMKGSPPRLLPEAIARVFQGGIYLSENATAHIVNGVTGQLEDSPLSRLGRLSDRELEVLELTGKGLDAHHVAERLGICSRTVDAHRAHIRKKLGIPDCGALLCFAIRWVELDKFSFG